MDKTDKKILKLLNKNLRPRYSKISKDLGITENAIKYRINKLQKAGIVRGYFADISAKACGKNITVYFMINVKASEYKNSIKKLKEYSEISKIYRCSGQYSLLCSGFFDDDKAMVDFLDSKLLKDLPITTWIETIILQPYKETNFSGDMISP